MSRTIRRKNASKKHWSYNDFDDVCWIRKRDLDKLDPSDYSLVYPEDSFRSNYVRLDKKSKEYKKRKAKYHSDAGTSHFREPGPGWFKTLYTLRPYRRKYKALAKKAMREDIEIVVEHIRYQYWT